MSNLKRGIEIGIVKNPLMDIAEEDVVLPLKNIIRVADDKDIDKFNCNERDAENALILCKDIVKRTRFGHAFSQLRIYIR